MHNLTISAPLELLVSLHLPLLPGVGEVQLIPLQQDKKGIDTPFPFEFASSSLSQPLLSPSELVDALPSFATNPEVPSLVFSIMYTYPSPDSSKSIFFLLLPCLLLPESFDLL